MDRIQELIDVLSDERVQELSVVSKKNQTCKICEKPANHFYSAASKFEYLVSGICEDCQQYYYGLNN